MIALIADKQPEIAELCRTYRVRRLDVFGSPATGKFGPDTSDVDFVVDLGEYDETVGARYMGLAAALEELFDRRIDLITEPSIRDGFFRSAISKERVTVYEAGNRQAVA